MAVPSKEQDHPFKGPYYLPLFEEEFVSNVADDHFTRFLKTSPAVEAFAYDETYTTQRAGDLLYQSWLQNDLGMLLRSMSLEEVYGGTEGQLFAQRVRRTVEPILFPVHIGSTIAHLDRDEESGLRPGDSYRRATFRGRFHDHVLKVDASGTSNSMRASPSPSAATRSTSSSPTRPARASTSTSRPSSPTSSARSPWASMAGSARCSSPRTSPSESRTS